MRIPEQEMKGGPMLSNPDKPMTVNYMSPTAAVLDNVVFTSPRAASPTRSAPRTRCTLPRRRIRIRRAA